LTNDQLRAVSVFAEAEDFKLPQGWRVVQGTGIDMYPAVSGGYTVHNAAEGTATLDVTIPKDGDYIMWVWFIKWVHDRSFVFRVEQDGKIAGESTYNRPEDKNANWSTNVQQGQQAVSLKAGPARLILSAPKFGGYVGSPIDCVLLTLDKTYTKPDWHDFSPLCGARVTMLTPTAPAVTVQVTSRIHHDPWWHNGPVIAGKDGKPIPPNTPSAWGEISSALDTGTNQATVCFTLKSAQPLPSRWKLRIELAAKTPAGMLVTKTVEEEWDGDTAAYVMPGDVGKYVQQYPIESINSISRRHYDNANALTLPGGKGDIRAKKLSLESDAVSVSPRLFALENQALACMGINTVMLYGKTYQDAAIASNMILSNAPSQCFIHDIGLTNCSFNPELRAKLEKYLTDWVEQMKKSDPVQFRNVRYVILADEPGTPNGLTHMTTCPFCQTAFRDWLRAKGKTPADFALPDWNAVKPVVPRKEDSLAIRRLGWYASQFAQESSPLPFKYATDCLQKAFGRPVGTRVNFSDECMSGFGNTMSNGNGHNWFEFGRLGATTLPWSEDFLYLDPFLTPFLTDVLRSTETTRQQPLGMYIIWGFGPPADPHSAELRAMTAVARGAKTLNYYWYGPYYSSTECASSEDAVYQQSMAYGNRVLALADDLLGPAMPPDRRVAILWSQATEQWPTDNMCTVERRMLHYALTMQQIPADFLCEKDLATRLKDYQVLYLPATNLPTECLLPLTAWVEAGGTLVVCGGGPERDEANEPWAGMYTLQGITGVVVHRDGGYRAEEQLKPSAEVTIDALKTTLSVGGCWSALTPSPNAVVTGRYQNGDTAIVEKRTGKGRVITYGFLPGMSQLTHADTAALAKRTFWKLMPESYYQMIADPIRQSGVRQPVSAQYGIDAARLDGPTGSVVTLANFTGQPIGKLVIHLYGNEKFRKIVSAINNPVTVVRTPNGLNITLPLATVDVIKLYK